MAIRIEEKRAFPRINLRVPLRYQVIGTGEFNNAITNDIGFKGLAFTNDRFIAPKVPVALEIRILSRMLHPTGKVAWINPLPHSDRFRLGVEFSWLEKEEQSYLRDYLDMQTARF